MIGGSAPVRTHLTRALVAALCTAGIGCSAPSARPDVVLVVIDTLRADHVGCYGHSRNTTPNIDALAAAGLRFEAAYSQAPWTTPSFASMLTSQYPSALGVTDKPDRLDDRFMLLPEVLSDHGWATGAIISHYFLKAKWNLCQGFDTYDESAIVGHRGVSGDITTRAALEFVDRHPDRPVFLMVHYFDPHYDYIEHDGYFDTPDPTYGGPISSGMVYRELREIVPDLEEADLGELRRLYDSEIAYTDARIGELFEGLRSRDRFDDAIIVVTADHGEEFRERRTVGHGGTVYNELIRVPLVIKLPRSVQIGEMATPVALVDLYPTVLDLVGLSVEHEIAGASMVDGHGRIDPFPRPVFSETDWGFYRTIIEGDHKLIAQTTSGRRWYFDLNVNPAERGGRLDDNPDLAPKPNARRLGRLLDDWMATIQADPVPATTVEVTDEEREQLEALGYLD